MAEVQQAAHHSDFIGSLEISTFEVLSNRDTNDEYCFRRAVVRARAFLGLLPVDRAIFERAVFTEVINYSVLLGQPFWIVHPPRQRIQGTS
jgi:hypothetical protein